MTFKEYYQKRKVKALDLKKLKEVARSIKHCGDYGRLWLYDNERVLWIGADSDSNDEYTSEKEIKRMFLTVNGIRIVDIEAEGGNPTSDGWERIDYKN